MNTLPEFPVDDYILDIILDSFKSGWICDEEGNHTLPEGEFSFYQVLNLLSGYDESLSVQYEDEDFHTHDDIMDYPGEIYGANDVIIALINEIKRLRNERL